MKDPSEPSRRQFLRSAIRWVALPVLVGSVGKMTARKGESCVNQTICRTCGIAETCGLPQALSYRDVIKREDGRGR